MSASSTNSVSASPTPVPVAGSLKLDHGEKSGPTNHRRAGGAVEEGGAIL